MKASILLLAGSVGIALAQPTSSLTERDHVESPLCPWFGDDNPLQPTPACCYNVPWTKERYPYKVCMAPSNADNTADFEASCQKINPKARPVCCPQSLITDDPEKNVGDDILCYKAKTVN
ncbi:hypothetical protein N7533_004792 [Penicillium manginii]|uniref:uncharacterized protein n=1 Tax=Penicillium manginii TaxID=203109 RepID=UPI002546E407|nr:uncharacterized protein N7533_004792 [Penicillium manginii]KAJ5755249.1 hypothetical protein N7533_004792 [Penicillium manginii]